MKKSILLLLVGLLSNGWLFANHWIPDDSQYEDNMTLTGVIQINGIEQQSTALEVGVFCGEECRGSEMPTFFPPTQRYVVQLTIFGEIGDQLTFKLFDHNLNQELNLTSPDAVTFTANGYGSLQEPYVLNFTGSVTETYTITVSVDPTEGGAVTGAGNYEEGRTCTLVATANEGYAFSNWTEGGVEVSTNASYAFTVTSDRNLVANFISSGTHWIPNESAYEDNMTLTGVIQINGVEQQSTTLEVGVFCGEECRGTGLPTYFFPTQRYVVQLTIFGENGDQLTFKLYDHDTSQELDLTSPDAVTFTANGYGSLQEPYVLNFTGSATETYTITVSVNPTEGGTVTGAGNYEEGQTCTLVATANEGYAFTNWTEGGVEVSTNASYAFTVTSDRNLVANFISSGTHWIPNESAYEDNMTLTGVIQINGVEQQSTTLEVGVFCGEECRGVGLPTYFPPTQRYVVQLIIFGENGDQLTFKLFDHNLNQELNLTSPDAVTFATNGYGSLGDPYVLNFTGAASQTYNLPITGYGNNAGGYYLIAPPIDNVDPADIEGMTEGDFDLYYFDEGEELEWRNYEANAFNLVSGKGYLYAHRTDVTLTFTGTPYNGNGQVTLSKDGNASLGQWNLIGNPLSTNATLGTKPFYIMNASGTDIIAADNDHSVIAPMQGVFVEADSNGETVTFSPASAKGRADNEASIVLNLAQNSAVIDRVIVRMGKCEALPKLQIRDGNTKVYILQDGEEYAIVSSDGHGELPVNFRAAENGTYTLTANLEGVEIEYLHLIDNLTCADIDLLQTPDYTFNAKRSDNASRFKVVFVRNDKE